MKLLTANASELRLSISELDMVEAPYLLQSKSGVLSMKLKTSSQVGKTLIQELWPTKSTSFLKPEDTDTYVLLRGESDVSMIYQPMTEAYELVLRGRLLIQRSKDLQQTSLR